MTRKKLSESTSTVALVPPPPTGLCGGGVAWRVGSEVGSERSPRKSCKEGSIWSLKTGGRA